MVTESTEAVIEQLGDSALSEIYALRDDFARFMMPYKFAIDEVMTKISILREEFAALHSENPIEHVNSRLKSTESVLEKVARKGIAPSYQAIRTTITDIAGIRVVCSFVSDVYRVFDALTAQSDVRVIEVKDYIANPKPNGYKSLHAIIEIPVFLSDGPVPVTVEVQLRTVAMDFWASLEHKIYYKYDADVPAEMLAGLHDAADVAAELDSKMEELHRQVRRDTRRV
ncbi:GTP pyrophosphokinase family protein [Gryllotalpicola protaetiae]|uniref:GTP pyrophosphokinase family protein n=2 Tax=Gryllotalpicola protaetiae TaxID=2419771 RepID=A0A387BNB0_9MICO|nr:GTP pyrophosphokinase family protein [Gryllotalpicola protaetiae]